MNNNKITFILHKPQLSENIGACARAIKNFNFQNLYMIDPKPIFPNDKILATSVGAKDVINKIKSSGLSDTYRAIKTKIDYPMVMGYSAVGTVSLDNKKYNLVKGTRVFTNSCHQEEGLVDYNMCVKIPDEVDFKSASFGAIGGIALQSIKCIPKSSSTIALIGLGLLGQVTSVPMEELMKHKEAMAKKDIQNVDPVVSGTTVVNVYSEDDFDEQFEALSKALSEEE